MNPWDLLNIVCVKDNNMEWIVNIETSEEERKQRIKFIFAPMGEEIWLHGEVKVKNGTKLEWVTFSAEQHDMNVTLPQLQELMGKCVVAMRRRLDEYENLDKGFSVLKWVGFEEED